MKVRIVIDGNYGHYENGVVYPKNKNSEPFELDDMKAKDLIAREIAVAVDVAEKDDLERDMKATYLEDSNMSYLEEYSFKELQKLAKDRGLSGAGSKAELIARILESDAGDKQSVGTSADDESPVLIAQDPV
jgi:hypothetical protein